MADGTYDALIVGAGPGGATAAAFMAQQGQRVLLIDQSTFPRDKVCGDAISGKSVEVLRDLDLMDAVVEAESLGSWGVIFSAPSGEEVAIPFTKMLDKPVAPGFVSPRTVFDTLVFEKAVAAGAETLLETKVTGLLRDGKRVTGVTVKHKDGTPADLHAPLVIGADGAYSVVARELGMTQLDEGHYCGGLRVYYEGVTGFHDLNFIELHFVEESLPGYFWIFPMADGKANIGIGMLSSAIKKHNVKLRPLLDELIDHPRFRDRFANAKRISGVKGWGLPLGSKPRPMAGDGWLLLGDAASLIDPFTGEGIGNAMVSGAFAAQWSAQAQAANDYSAAFLHGYEKDVLRRLRGELRLSHTMQKLVNWKWLLNTVIRKANRSEELADTISCMFDDLDLRKKLASPLFYLRVLTA